MAVERFVLRHVAQSESTNPLIWEVDSLEKNMPCDVFSCCI